MVRQKQDWKTTKTKIVRRQTKPATLRGQTKTNWEAGNKNF
jgi:hypothetical protein